MAIRYFELCAGIGAPRIAADMVGGYECVGWCEIDPIAQIGYRALHGEREVFFNDARTLDPAAIPPFDILIGGIPCQSWSSAGRHGGFNDERGQLFFDYARILEKRHPPMFIIENVPALLSADSGNAYHIMLSKIHELGYDAEWQIVDGSAYLPQARKRLFLVGYLNKAKCAGEIFPIGIESKKAVCELTDHNPQGARVYDAGKSAITQTASAGGGHGGFYFVDLNADSKLTDNARCITTRQDSGISHHKGEHSGVFLEYDGVYPIINPDREKVRQNGRRIKNNGEPAFCCTVMDRHGIIHKGRIRKLLPIECWRLFGFSDEQYEKVAKALNYSDAKLYKLAGNSIMVPVLVELLTKIKEVAKKYNLFESEESVWFR